MRHHHTQIVKGFHSVVGTDFPVTSLRRQRMTFCKGAVGVRPTLRKARDCGWGQLLRVS